MSYLIVDEADEDLEMSPDPFLEAGIDIPSDLPQRPSVANLVDNVSLAPSNASSRMSHSKLINMGNNIKSLHRNLMKKKVGISPASERKFQRSFDSKLDDADSIVLDNMDKLDVPNGNAGKDNDSFNIEDVMDLEKQEYEGSRNPNEAPSPDISPYSQKD